ncbi:TetR/AcrR family transcriptional regulator [Flavobacterium salilacus subsp. salilacus]|uniref:TetR/AcrR family transcriptional regulator n=1 Tax=Flavobacterium TaxID=237 RepID=UPI0010755CFE|nr:MULTISPECIES: TetR/AcrR family transcriptional regulator [Flavobacterium]KAF2520159.1 TetR/AcrR family transcriptional regulator [Flavobacterium salilacus subsp. salilacus]MBE1613924.1 TetR/AcrR family transcriptional regulator [Flavobacterium sp. SaA2.13]NDI97966.1 TetR/AcrR family transcriptional regulator [Flavobacterium salilacus subsp. altitudinum]
MSDKKDIDTEQLIKDTAKKIFFGEGRFNATTQEIADAAGVNRTLINYYFRSRDNLFNIVFEDAQQQEHDRTESIVFSDLPLREKIEQHLDMFFEESKKYPYLEIYMVTQMNQGNCHKDIEAMNRLLDKFYLEIGIEMEKGNVPKMRPEQFVLNFISLMSFPVSMRPLLQETMGFSQESYDRLLEERKQIILNILFNQ